MTNDKRKVRLIMKNVIEKEIEKYVDIYNKYPSEIVLTEDEFVKIQKEMKKELERIGEIPPDVITSFRGCKLTKSRNITKFYLRGDKFGRDYKKTRVHC